MAQKSRMPAKKSQMTKMTQIGLFSDMRANPMFSSLSPQVSQRLILKQKSCDRETFVGEDGLEELTEDFNPSKIQYAFLKVEDPKTSLPKFVLLNWQVRARKCKINNIV